jgi:hypothetical protein
VIFDPLSHDKLKEIVKIQMKGVVARVANKGISLHASDAALDVILSESYDPVSIKASSIDHTKSLRLSLLGQVVSSLCVLVCFGNYICVVYCRCTVLGLLRGGCRKM